MVLLSQLIRTAAITGRTDNIAESFARASRRPLGRADRACRRFDSGGTRPGDRAPGAPGGRG
jgi:hypothetical protein